LHHQQPEKDEENVGFTPPWKNFCGRPWMGFMKHALYFAFQLQTQEIDRSK